MKCDKKYFLLFMFYVLSKKDVYNDSQNIYMHVCMYRYY